MTEKKKRYTDEQYWTAPAKFLAAKIKEIKGHFDAIEIMVNQVTSGEEINDANSERVCRTFERLDTLKIRELLKLFEDVSHEIPNVGDMGKPS